MKAEHTERHNALITLRLVRELASISVQPCDADAASVAILVRAIEIATPDLSSEARASLFHQFPATPQRNAVLTA